MLRIGEVAELAGVSTRTIRHYHQIGLLPEPARSANGYRVYDEAELRVVREIRSLLAVGFDLDDIRPFVACLRAGNPSGDLTLVEGGGTIGAKTVSGTVVLDLTTTAVQDVRVTSISGDVTIRLPQSSDLQVQLQSTSGQVASAFDELMTAGRPALSTVSGRLGAGTGRLRASTTSGQVALLRREPDVEELR